MGAKISSRMLASSSSLSSAFAQQSLEKAKKIGPLNREGRIKARNLPGSPPGDDVDERERKRRSSSNEERASKISTHSLSFPLSVLVTPPPYAGRLRFPETASTQNKKRKNEVLALFPPRRRPGPLPLCHPVRARPILPRRQRVRQSLRAEPGRQLLLLPGVGVGKKKEKGRKSGGTRTSDKRGSTSKKKKKDKESEVPEKQICPTTTPHSPIPESGNLFFLHLLSSRKEGARRTRSGVEKVSKKGDEKGFGNFCVCFSLKLEGCLSRFHLKEFLFIIFCVNKRARAEC